MVKLITDTWTTISSSNSSSRHNGLDKGGRGEVRGIEDSVSDEEQCSKPPLKTLEAACAADANEEWDLQNKKYKKLRRMGALENVFQD